MRETPLGCKILELNDAANIPLESANNEILEAAIEKKVDKVEGKGLSTNDYTTTEKNKLAGIDSGANKYVHPATHPATIIVEDANNRFVTDVEKSNWNSAAEKGIPYASASGTNTYTASVAGLSSLTEGLSVKIKFLNANTGASTLNINSLGAKALKKSNGSELSSGNIKAGQICHLVYTGSNFQLLGEGGEYGTAQAGDVLTGKTIGTEAGLIEGTIPSKSAETITPGTSNKIIAAGQYLSGNQTILGDPSLVSSNIKANASIFNVQGDSNVVNTADSNATAANIRSGYTAYVKGNKLTGTIPSKTSESFTPGTSNQIINSGQYLSGNQTILGDAHLIPANIKDGVNIFGVVGTHKSFPSTDFVVDMINTTNNGIFTTYYCPQEWIAITTDSRLYFRALSGTSWIQGPQIDPDSQLIYHIIYDNFIYVAVGFSGIFTATGILSWTKRTSNMGGSQYYATDVAYGKNLWVVVGGGGRIVTASDPTSTWTQRTSGTTEALQTVVYANNTWVTGGTNGVLLTSSNGTSWTSHISSFGTSTIKDIIYASDIWVAVGDDGKIATCSANSADSGWVQRTSPFTVRCNSVEYGGGVFMVTDYYNNIAFTRDFNRWDKIDIPSLIKNGFGAIAYGDGRLCLGGNEGYIGMTPNQLWNFTTI